MLSNMEFVISRSLKELQESTSGGRMVMGHMEGYNGGISGCPVSCRA